MQEKEAMMMEQLRTQREELLWEKQRVETQLQEEWSKKLAEKDKSLQQLQKEMKETLEKEIRDKELMMLQQLESQRAALQVWLAFLHPKPSSSPITSTTLVQDIYISIICHGS